MTANPNSPLTPPAVVPLDAAADLPVALVGTKAHNLARAARLLPGVVPPGFVVTATASCGLDAEAVRERYRRLAGPTDGGVLAVAVRSSADVEDLPASSCSGLFETVLDVRGEAALLTAIRHVRDGARRHRLDRYLRSHGVPPGTVAMGVLVMPMVNTRLAGVAFSRDPVDGRAHVTIELAPGDAAALMAGAGATERHVVDPVSHEVVALHSERPAPLLTSAAREAVVRLVERLHSEYATGGAAGVDVEFAFDAAGAPRLLQVRPFVGPRRSARPLPRPENVRALRFPAALTPCPGQAEGVLVTIAPARFPRRVPKGAILAVDCFRKGLFLSEHFERAGGFVSRQGALLDHGANLLREAGIPAIVAVGSGMDVLLRHRGQRIQLDASRRTVHLLECPGGADGPLALRADRASTKDDLLRSRAEKVVRETNGCWIGRPLLPQQRLQLALRSEAYRRIERIVGTRIETRSCPRRGFLVRVEDMHRIRDWLAGLPGADARALRARRRVEVQAVLALLADPRDAPLARLLDGYVTLLAWAQLGGLLCDRASKDLEAHLERLGVPVEFSGGLLAGRHVSELSVRQQEWADLVAFARRDGVPPLLVRRATAGALRRRHPEVWRRIERHAASFRHTPAGLSVVPPLHLVLPLLRRDLRSGRSPSARPPASRDVETERRVRRGMSETEWRALETHLDAAAWEAWMADSEQEYLARAEHRLRAGLVDLASRQGRSLRRILAGDLAALHALLERGRGESPGD